MVTVPAFDPAPLPGDATLDHTKTPPPPHTTPPPAARASRGVDRLYSHQAEAYANVRAGRHLVVVTPTASGKTLCYNLPVLQGLLERPDSRAPYLFPTTAPTTTQRTA